MSVATDTIQINVRVIICVINAIAIFVYFHIKINSLLKQI